MNKSYFGKNDWLEALVYFAAHNARPHDLRWKVPVKGVETDIDVGATYGPRMLVCSCKSSSFENSHLDQLDSLARKVGGTFCEKALVLTEAIPMNRKYQSMEAKQNAIAQAREKLERRASQLGVHVWYSSDYAQLSELIQKALKIQIPRFENQSSNMSFDRDCQ